MSNKKINQLHSKCGDQTRSKNHLSIIRKHLKNKLIEAGLNCSEPHASNLKKKSKEKRPNFQQKDVLPLIPSLKNSMSTKQDLPKSLKSRNLFDIFSHRDLFIFQEAFVGSKLCRSRQKDRSLEDFQENFRRRLLDNIKLQKMSKKISSLQQVHKREKFNIEESQQDTVNSVEGLQESKQTIHFCPRSKLNQKRSKTQQKQKVKWKANDQRIKQINTNIMNHQNLSFKTLTPWGQYNEHGYWKNQFS